MECLYCEIEADENIEVITHFVGDESIDMCDSCFEGLFA